MRLTADYKQEAGAALVIVAGLITTLLVMLSFGFGIAAVGTSSLQQHGLARHSAEAALMTLVKTVAESGGRLNTFSPEARQAAIDAASRVTSMNFLLLERTVNQGTNFTALNGSTISFGYCQRHFGQRGVTEARCYPMTAIPSGSRTPCITNAVKVDLRTVGAQHANHWLLFKQDIPLNSGSVIAYFDITTRNRTDAGGATFSPYLFVSKEHWGNYFVPDNLNCRLFGQGAPMTSPTPRPSLYQPSRYN